MASTFRDLRVWREAMALTAQIYRITAEFPRNETYGLAQKMRRAAVSVPGNIAEGKDIAQIRSSPIICFIREARYGSFRRKF